MKKVSLFLGMVLAASFAMAQNTATVTDNGDGNRSYVNQLGATNNAIIDQIGDLNNADFIEPWDHFKSSIDGIGILAKDARGVTQVGDDNTGIIIQHNAFVGIGQAGPIAGLKQTGNKNTASITQTASSAWMQDYAWAKQSGDGNNSTQNQISTNSYSFILQQGVTQVDPNVAVGNTATTQQISTSSNANIWQIGERNNAYQLQTVGTGWSSGNLAEATQNGNDNISNQYQYGSSNTAKTQQLTNWNVANITQNGNANRAEVLQETGDVNIVNLTQDGGAQADIVQDGDHNTLMGIDTDIMATSLNGSTLDLDQIGSGNTLHLQQTNGASATVMQDGMTNTSVVIQN